MCVLKGEEGSDRRKLQQQWRSDVSDQEKDRDGGDYDCAHCCLCMSCVGRVGIGRVGRGCSEVT